MESLGALRERQFRLLFTDQVVSLLGGAYDWFGSMAFQPVGLIVAGPAAALVGESTTLWIAAASALTMAALAFATPSVRRLERLD